MNFIYYLFLYKRKELEEKTSKNLYHYFKMTCINNQRSKKLQKKKQQKADDGVYSSKHVRKQMERQENTEKKPKTVSKKQLRNEKPKKTQNKRVGKTQW